MIYSEINGTNLRASKIILGTDGFGTEMSEELSFAMLDRFIELGGNIIDTASFYADWKGIGKSLSEKTIGKWIEKRGGRDDIIISTKGGHPNHETMNISRLSREEIFSDFENSLINLRTDYIDIYWLHKDDPTIPPEELIETMNAVLDTGKAHYIAVSNWSYDRIKKANDYALSHGLTPFIASQIQHSIAKVNEEVLDKLITPMTAAEYKKYAADNLNVFCFSSQAKGFFALMDNGGVDALTNGARKEFLNDYNLELLKKLQDASKKTGLTVSALMLAALVSDKKINIFAQIGPRKMEFLEDSMTVCDVCGGLESNCFGNI